MKNKFVICSVLIIILTVCIAGTGCTSTQTQPSAQNISPSVTTPAQTQNPTTAPETPATTLVPAASQTAVVTTTGTPAIGGLSVTINSAVKKTLIGTISPKAGNIFLVLDVTIQNNDKNNDFDYTAASFTILDKVNNNRRAPLGKFTSGLDNQFTSGTIPLKSKISGQIAFGVMDSSNSYKLSVSDSTGTVVASVDNITVS